MNPPNGPPINEPSYGAKQHRTLAKSWITAQQTHTHKCYSILRASVLSQFVTLLTPYAILPYPWYLPRSRKDTKSLMMTVVNVLIPPPPRPATRRATTSDHKLGAAPQSNEPMKKTTVAKSKADLRPKTSEIRPSAHRKRYTTPMNDWLHNAYNFRSPL